MALFRVQFDGSALWDLPSDDLIVGADWEGTRGSSNGPDRHSFLIERSSPTEAIADLRSAVEAHGAFDRFVAVELTPPAGWQGLGTLDRPIDWETIRARCQLTELQQTLVETILNAAEPTWIVLNDPEVNVSRKRVEAAFRDLEDRGLVFHRREASGNPATGVSDAEHWWSITDHGWQAFGLIKRPWYNGCRGPDAP